MCHAPPRFAHMPRVLNLWQKQQQQQLAGWQYHCPLAQPPQLIKKLPVFKLFWFAFCQQRRCSSLTFAAFFNEAIALHISHSYRLAPSLSLYLSLSAVPGAKSINITGKCWKTLLAFSSLCAPSKLIFMMNLCASRGLPFDPQTMWIVLGSSLNDALFSCIP